MFENGCEKQHFRSEIESGFGEPGGTPLPRITRSTPPGGGELSRDVSEKKLRVWPFLLLNSEHRSFVLYGKKYS